MFDTINLETFLMELSENNWTVFNVTTEFAQKLKTRLIELKLQNLFKPSAIAMQNMNDGIRNDLICWLPEDSEHPLDIQFNFYLTHLLNELKNYFRISLSNFETHFSIYPPGHFYKKHSDQKKIENRRFFSFVIYLNPNWSTAHGGSLCGYAGEKKIFEIQPELGTVILFKSDLIHEVMTAQRERHSLVGWFRT